MKIQAALFGQIYRGQGGYGIEDITTFIPVTTRAELFFSRMMSVALVLTEVEKEPGSITAFWSTAGQETKWESQQEFKDDLFRGVMFVDFRVIVPAPERLGALTLHLLIDGEPAGEVSLTFVDLTRK